MRCKTELTSKDKLLVDSILVGDFILQSTVLDGADGIVRNSCQTKITANLFFGKSGTGKSTIASLVSGTPGLFKSASSASATTTIGTWISRKILMTFVMI